MALYQIDPLHSDIGFKVKHLMISTVNGCFQKFNATMETSTEDFSDAVIKFECDVDSIYTNIQDRDSHLKSADFFDNETYPKITFASTSVEKTGESYVVKGNLTIKDVTREIELAGSYNGNDVDHYGQTKYGFELEGKISREDFGLTFNIAGGKGSALIGNEIKLQISIQMLAVNAV
jgi:polyisoprenoid-binding protein YceI